MTTAEMHTLNGQDEKAYRRRIWAWTMYDWANSAFATTILAAVLPVYFSQVAGATLPSAAIATAYWSTGLSLSLFIIALFSPILGTISDVKRGKKPFLAVFAGLGILATALLVLVDTGDWVLASVLAVIGRIGFSGANVFYDALLPHVARPEDQDTVSTRGYAMGYLGGGLLLAINIVMIQLLPGTWGARLSFLSVAIWWTVFSIPLFLRIPEPPSATAPLQAGQNVVLTSFRRIAETLGDIRQYRELFKYLVAFLIYNDAIGTIIGVAAIYGAELGFGSLELILALLLVQFVGIPFSLIFGRLPRRDETRRPFFLAFVVFNVIALPLAGLAAARWLPVDQVGGPPAPIVSTADAYGEGSYALAELDLPLQGAWERLLAPVSEEGVYLTASDPGARLDFPLTGRFVRLTYQTGPASGVWAVEVDGEVLRDPESGEPVLIDAYNSSVRYDVTTLIDTGAAGRHTLSLVNLETRNPDSQGNQLAAAQIEVLPGPRVSNLPLIIGLIIVIEILGLVFAFLLGRPLFTRWVGYLDTQSSILLALVIYGVIAIWGFFLNTAVEFWMLAWMVAVVQGGSQALSRSLYAAMSPAAKSGEFFGLFGVMEKFSAIIGPLLFAAAGLMLGSSRPAILSLVVLFFLGGYLLRRVDVAKGKRVAQMEDARYLHSEA